MDTTTDDLEAAVHCGAMIVSVKCIILSIIERFWGKKSKSRRPVQAGCDRRPISPVIGSVVDVRVVTLLPVVPVVIMDVAIAC
jgi:hypothetical protein